MPIVGTCLKRLPGPGIPLLSSAWLEIGSRLGSGVGIEFRWKRVSMQSDPPGR